jgi:ribonuclease HI
MCVSILTHAIQQGADEAIPYRKPIHRRAVPWWTQELTDLKRLSRAAGRHYHQSSNLDIKPLLHQYYREYCKAFKRAIKRAKRKSWESYCSTRGNTHPWTTVYRILKRSKTQCSMYFTASSSDKNLGDIINGTLSTLFPQDNSSNDTSAQRRSREAVALHLESRFDPSTIEYISACEVKDAIFSFQPTKAPGDDHIFMLIIQKTFGRLLQLLTFLFNSCLRLSYFPNSWKNGKLILLRKPDASIQPPKCYRPIVLLSVLGKLFERILLKRLEFYNSTQHWISPSQYGFSPGKSTEQALFHLVDFITIGFSRGQLTGAVFLDISGAFDNAWHPGVLSFLIQQHCPLWLLLIINSYLLHRAISFQYQDLFFTRTLSKSCPQGGVLSPFIWNCAVNSILDIPLDPDNELLQGYADDLVFCTRGKSVKQIQVRLQDKIHSFLEWASLNKLSFNLAKTKLLLFSRAHTCPELDILICGTHIEHVSTVKYLGVHLDRKLLFTSHVENTCAKACRLIFELSRCARQTWGLSRSAILTLYQGAILPIVLYGSPAWGYVCLKQHIQTKLQRVCRLAALRALRAYKTTPTSALEILCNLPPAHLLVQQRCLLFYHSTGLLHSKMRFLLPATGFNLYPIEPAHPPINPFLRGQHYIPVILDYDASDSIINTAKTLHFYSDGSKSECSVGCSSVIYRESDSPPCFTVRKRLASYCTIFQAEQHGLLLGAQWVSQRQISGFTLKFFTDNQALLHALNTFTNSLAIRPLLSLLQSLAEHHTVSLHWVPAHTGIAGNEEADQQAKEAAASDEPCVFLPLSRSGAVRLFQPYLLHVWQASWDSALTGRLLHDFCPVLPFAFAHYITSASSLQFLTGHGNFRSYMFRFGHSSHTTCVCGAPSEDSVHLIYDCPQYAYQRACFITALAQQGFSWPLLPSALFATKHTALLFLQFLSTMKRPSNF